MAVEIHKSFPVVEIFATTSAGSSTLLWGNIAGTLANQVDLQAALDAKAPSTPQFLTLATHSGIANERVFTPSADFQGTDGGAGSTYTLALATQGGLTPGTYNTFTVNNKGIITAASGVVGGSPITTRGDIIVGDVSGFEARLPIGTATYVLTSDGTDASWAAPTGGGGDMLLGTVQTVTAAKTFNDTTLLMKSSSTAFTGRFTNAITGSNKVYTLPNVTGTIVLDPSTTDGDLIYHSGGELVALSTGLSGETLIADGVGSYYWQVINGLTDGDKGDVTVSVSGTTWTVDTSISKNWTGAHTYYSTTNSRTLTFFRDQVIAGNQEIGRLTFNGKNSSSGTRSYFDIVGKQSDNTFGNESSIYVFSAYSNGTPISTLSYDGATNTISFGSSLGIPPIPTASLPTPVTFPRGFSFDSTLGKHVLSNGSTWNNIVTETTSATLTNKTFALGSNTFSGTKAQFNTAATDGDFLFVGDTIPVSKLAAAAATNSIDNLNYKQTWNYSTLASDVAFEIISTSTLAASNAQVGMRVILNGANANSAQTTTAFVAASQHTGTTSTNIAGLFTASGGSTANYSLVLTGDIRLENTNTLIAATNGIGRTLTFLPGTDVVGINVGSTTANPSIPSDGDIYYNSTSEELRARINGAWVTLGAGGGGGITNGAANTELMMSNGTNAIASGIFVPSAGDLNLGTGVGGATRTVTAAGSATDIAMSFVSKGTGVVKINNVDFRLATASALFPSGYTLIGQDAFQLRSTGTGTLIIGAASATAAGQPPDVVIEGTGAGVGGSSTVGGTLKMFGGQSGITGIKSGDVIISGGQASAGNADGGDTYITYGVKAGSGKDGNVAFFTNSISNWQSMERGMAITNRLTAPTAGITNSVALFAEDSNSSSELYVYTESGAKINISGLLPPVVESGTSITLNETHRNKTVVCTNSGAITVTLNTGKVDGWNCVILVTHATGTVTLAGTATINGTTSTTSQYETLSLLNYGSDVYISVGGTGGGGSGITRSISSVSSTTSAGASASTDYVYNCTSTFTLTLPTAVGNTNRYTIKNSGTGTITVDTTSSQTIDGGLTAVMSVQYASIDLISNGTNWLLI